MSSDSGFSAVWANALPHTRSTAKAEYRYLMRSSSIDLGADVFHELCVFCVLVADLDGKFLGRGDPGFDPARVGQLVSDIRQHERLVHLGAEAGERGFRSAGRREQAVPLDHDEVGIEL